MLIPLNKLSIRMIKIVKNNLNQNIIKFKKKLNKKSNGNRLQP